MSECSFTIGPEDSGTHDLSECSTFQIVLNTTSSTLTTVESDLQINDITFQNCNNIETLAIGSKSSSYFIEIDDSIEALNYKIYNSAPCQIKIGFSNNVYFNTYSTGTTTITASEIAKVTMNGNLALASSEESLITINELIVKSTGTSITSSASVVVNSANITGSVTITEKIWIESATGSGKIVIKSSNGIIPLNFANSIKPKLDISKVTGTPIVTFEVDATVAHNTGSVNVISFNDLLQTPKKMITLKIIIDESIGTSDFNERFKFVSNYAVLRSVVIESSDEELNSVSTDRVSVIDNIVHLHPTGIKDGYAICALTSQSSDRCETENDYTKKIASEVGAMEVFADSDLTVSYRYAVDHLDYFMVNSIADSSIKVTVEQISPVVDRLILNNVKASSRITYVNANTLILIDEDNNKLDLDTLSKSGYEQIYVSPGYDSVKYMKDEYATYPKFMGYAISGDVTLECSNHNITWNGKEYPAYPIIFVDGTLTLKGYSKYLKLEALHGTKIIIDESFANSTADIIFYDITLPAVDCPDIALDGRGSAIIRTSKAISLHEISVINVTQIRTDYINDPITLDNFVIGDSIEIDNEVFSINTIYGMEYAPEVISYNRSTNACEYVMSEVIYTGSNTAFSADEGRYVITGFTPVSRLPTVIDPCKYGGWKVASNAVIYVRPYLRFIENTHTLCPSQPDNCLDLLLLGKKWKFHGYEIVNKNETGAYTIYPSCTLSRVLEIEMHYDEDTLVIEFDTAETIIIVVVLVVLVIGLIVCCFGTCWYRRKKAREERGIVTPTDIQQTPCNDQTPAGTPTNTSTSIPAYSPRSTYLTHRGIDSAQRRPKYEISSDSQEEFSSSSS